MTHRRRQRLRAGERKERSTIRQTVLQIGKPDVIDRSTEFPIILMTPCLLCSRVDFTFAILFGLPLRVDSYWLLFPVCSFQNAFIDAISFYQVRRYVRTAKSDAKPKNAALILSYTLFHAFRFQTLVHLSLLSGVRELFDS